ncbi:hypothetical protein [Pedobacter sp.]|uniref:hypothetical protein n=1 Tax=Pedobacter sp. TaxID=1411316 RepID=UPI003BAA6650
MEFSGFIPTSYQPSMFSCVSMEQESVLVAPAKTEVLDMFVTEFPRFSDEDIPQTQFAFLYFEQDKVDFLKYQDTIQHLSKGLFGDTQLLSEFEQNVLNQTFQKSLKAKPTRPNRL